MFVWLSLFVWGPHVGRLQIHRNEKAAVEGLK